MNKRTWHYVMKPYEYSMHCDKCEGTNIEWSEYEGKIWCYDCEIDTDGFEGIFGIVGWDVAQAIGLSFNVWNMVKERVEYPRRENGQIVYYTHPTEGEKVE